MWVIVKKIKLENGIELPVLILNEQSEIMEFVDKIKAERMRDVLQVNSDSGHQYEIMGSDK